MINKYNIYSDLKSEQNLFTDKKKIILIGSCFGNSNFGDILQLQGTIAFYKKYTELDPVLVFDTANLSHANSVREYYKKYNVDIILFIDQHERTNIHEFGLNKITRVKSIQNLHLYGGGFMNNFWGDFVISVIAFFYQTFEVKKYIISGQQVNLNYAKKFAEHCEKYNPLLIGVRDFVSFNNLKQYNLNITFSFDDAVEELLKLKKIIANHPSHNTSSKHKHFLLHLNDSLYTNNSENNRLLECIELLKTNYPKYKVVIANAFNDIRYGVSDSLHSIVKLEDKFPYAHYDVLDLTKYSYNNADLNGLDLLNVDFGVASSYHVTLLLHLMKKPCWLLANNEFYDHKRESLSLNGNLSEFLEKRPINDYTAKLALRVKWIEKLKNIIHKMEETYTKTLINIELPKLSEKPFRWKSREIVDIRELEFTKKNADQFWQDFIHYKNLYKTKTKELEACSNQLDVTVKELADYKQKNQDLTIRIQKQEEELDHYTYLFKTKAIELTESLSQLDATINVLDQYQQQNQDLTTIILNKDAEIEDKNKKLDLINKHPLQYAIKKLSAQEKT